MSDSTESYEEHVLQNNNRLLSIAQSLRELSTFSSACTELTQWCSDPRAYTPHFEQNLLTALQICVENGTKEGYDFAIAHQLITCCFQHRKMLSKESAVRINRWYEQYRRIKKNGGKRKRKTETAPVDPAAFEQITVTDSGCTSSMWPQGGPMAGATPLQSPGYQPMMPMPGQYPGIQPSPFPPMDPTGARQAYPGDPNGYDPQTAMQMQHRQMMAMQQQHQMAMVQQQRRRAQAQAMGQAPAGYDQAMYNGIPMGANSVPGQSQPLLRMPSQPSMTSPAYPGMMAPGGRQVPQTMTTPAYPQGNPQMIRAGPPMLFGQLQNTPQHQQVMSYPNPHAPNGVIPPAPSELLMIPKGQPILDLFTISPENPTFHTTFDLSPEMCHQLTSTYLHLQLKSTKEVDTTVRTSWPTNENGELAIQVAVNGQYLQLNKDKSFFIKNLVKVGQNTLDIAPTQTAMRHFYMLQVVSIVPAAKVTEEIFATQRMKQFPPEFSKQKLMQRAVANGGSVSVSLMDPKLGGKLKIPTRSTKCQHTACFDLNATLTDHFECARLMCPVMGCGAIFAIDEIEIDEFVFSVLRESAVRNPAATQLHLDASGAYQLVDGAEPSTSRKRAADDSSSYTMKRIKSEQFPMPPTSSSPFPTSNSLPPAQIGQSPMMSPFPAHISPKKEVLSPAAAKLNGGPVTPAGLDPLMATTSGPQLSSPHHQPIQQHGSVEAPSLTGSAPYTPASMNGLPHPHPQDATLTQHNNSFSSLDIDDLLHTNMSVDDFQRYLLDSDNCCARESRVADDLWSEQALQDIREVISADLGKA